MRPFILYYIIIIFIAPVMIKGQGASDNVSGELEKLFGRLENNFDDIATLRINDSIRVIINSYARSDIIFKHRFDNLKYLGQITSSDSLVKIVTWNLVQANRSNMYFLYFIRKGEPEKGNRVYCLTADYREEQIKTDTTYSISDWYGALYYDLKPCLIDNKRFWILLGIDYGNPDISRKIIDVLSFTPDGSVMFGKKWFESGDRFKFREVFEYASNGIMTLRFSSDKSIVFDHLVPFNPWQKDDHKYYGPDYSYDAYNFENGRWRLSVNVDVRNKEQ